MTPKEKAKQLVEKFTDIENEYNEYSDFKQAKQCALIAVDELIKTVDMCIPHLNAETYAGYWKEVKCEIEVL
jgi:hypothetical protein